MTGEAPTTFSQYPIGLFTALIGILVTKGVISVAEVSNALSLVEEVETDEVSSLVYRLLGEALVETESTQTPILQVISGGLA